MKPKKLNREFITAAIAAGYFPSAAYQLAKESNMAGSYGLYLAGKPIPPVK